MISAVSIRPACPAQITVQGGYSNFTAYRPGILVYDAMAVFCVNHITPKNQTIDQMAESVS